MIFDFCTRGAESNRRAYCYQARFANFSDAEPETYRGDTCAEARLGMTELCSHIRENYSSAFPRGGAAQSAARSFIVPMSNPPTPSACLSTYFDKCASVF